MMYLELTSPVVFSYAWPQVAWGMGDVQTATTAVSAGGAALGAGATALASAGLISAAAVPFIGPAVAGITLAIGLLVKNSGCGPTCVITSQWANQAEPLLAQNIAAYFNSPAPRAKSLQEVALSNFDKIWATLKAQCSQPGTGNAGVRCISDRQSGSCKWNQTGDSPLLNYPGEPQPGECWNWFSGYRDPIANDPDVVPDTVAPAVNEAAAALSSGAAALSSATGLSGSSLLLLLAAGLIVGGVALS
jgi:hypothetical protein